MNNLIHKINWSTPEIIWVDMAKKILDGEKVYVKITHPKTRAGSIGYLKFSDNFVNPTHADLAEFNRGRYYGKIDRLSEYTLYKYKTDDKQIHFDDRKNPIKAERLEFEWLVDYEGPTNFIFDKSKVEKKEVVEENMKDFMGNDLVVGDIVSIVDNNNMIVGTISRYSGTRKSLFVKPIKVSSRVYYKSEIICSDPSRIMLVDKDLMDRLLIARLSN